MPDVVTRSTLKQYRDSAAVTELKQFEGRGHSLTIDSGWKEIADAVLTWLQPAGSEAMDPEVAGKVAVVTGASRGIGLAITRALADEGVLVRRRRPRHLPELDELADLGVVSVPVDLTDRDRAPAGWSTRRSPTAHLDILVNNVGAVTPRTNGFLMITDEQWQTTLTLNLITAVRTIRAALPSMLTAGRGSIVTTSSVNAFLPDPTVIDYSAAKAALTNFCKALSKESARAASG